MSTVESLLENLSPKQQDTLKRFRVKLEDVLQPHHDDFFLLRWLVARDFDISKAENMLRKSLLWRSNYGTDDILSWDPPEVLRKYWPGGLYGFDKKGHPILWQLSRDFDAKGVLKCVKRSDIIKYHVWRSEYLNKLCRDQTKKLGRRIACATHISDLSGFSLKMVFSPGITDITKETFAIMEANYPENLYSSYVINAPGVFAVFFNIIKPFLNEETKRKLTFLGRGWRDFLLNNIVNEDNLPACWGGSCVDPDEYCSDHISHGGKIPEHLYLTDKISLDRERMNDVTIQRGGTHTLTYDVTAPGSVIRNNPPRHQDITILGLRPRLVMDLMPRRIILWLFETESYDLNFGITVKPLGSPAKTSSDHVTDIRQMSRVNSHQVPEDGNIRCQQTGTYTLKFDNSYSWVHSKKLYFEVEMIEPVIDPLFNNCNSIPDDGEDVILESTYL